MPEKIKFIGFDLNGTLTNDMPSYAAEFGRLVSEKLQIDSQLAADHFLKTAGKPTIFQLNTLINLVKVSPLSLKESEQWADLLDEALVNAKGEAFPDVEPVLKKLQQEGYQLFVSSGHTHTAVPKVLKTHGIDHFFPFQAGFDPSRPGFEKGIGHFQAAAKFFNTPWEKFQPQTIFIGDAEADMRLAREAGITPIGRTGTLTKEQLQEAGAYKTVKTLLQLKEHLDKMP